MQTNSYVHTSFDFYNNYIYANIGKKKINKKMNENYNNKNKNKNKTRRKP